jgi:PAS domain S-box-containing protein
VKSAAKARLKTTVSGREVAGSRALADSEAQFRRTFDNAPIGIVHRAPDGRYLRVNKVACRILGYSADELTAKSAHSISHPDDLAASAARFQRMLDGKIDRYDAEKRLLHKDGSTAGLG